MNRLFFYDFKLPSPPSTVRIISYADDGTVTLTGTAFQRSEENINVYLPDLHFLGHNGINKYPHLYGLLQSWTNEVTRELNININGQKIPTAKQPKVLGLNFDKHTEGIVKKVGARNRILKVVTASA